MAVEAGVRAEICTIEVPSRIRDVWAPHQARGVKASDPHDSAVKTMSKPRRSASRTFSTASAGGCTPQYPSCSPSFTTAAYLCSRTRSHSGGGSLTDADDRSLYERLQDFVGTVDRAGSVARDPVN